MPCAEIGAVSMLPARATVGIAVSACFGIVAGVTTSSAEFEFVALAGEGPRSTGQLQRGAQVAAISKVRRAVLAAFSPRFRWDG